MDDTDPKALITPDEILIAEFEYIAQSAFQANEDRARVASFYALSVSSLVAAILGAKFLGEEFDLQYVYLAFAGLFLFLTALGALTIAQLARLRVAWREAAKAMNQIKEYYISRSPRLEDAFAWRTNTTLPETDKKYSIANLMATEVALLGAITFGAAFFCLLLGLDTQVLLGLLVSVIFGAGGCFALLIWYRRLLAWHQDSSSPKKSAGEK